MQYKSLLQIWSLVYGNWYLSMKGKNFNNKEKYNAKAGDESKAKKKKKLYYNKRLGRQMLRCNPQNKISYLHNIAKTLAWKIPWAEEPGRL